jgi:hypothetical protein
MKGLPMTLLLRRWLVALATILCCTTGAIAQSRPVVVELFTSEGCNSCPPAEAYVGQLSTRSDVVALAFHVDYWDELGWRDRFALPQSVDRQNIYARNLHRSSVYTPQLVIDGRSDTVGANSAAVTRALSERREEVPLTLSVRDAEVRVDVGARPELPRSDVVLVAYLHHVVSAIGRGENAGRTLEEFNVVRGIRTLGAWTGEFQSFDVSVSSLPPDATHVAVLIQPFGQAPIIGAAAHALR